MSRTGPHLKRALGLWMLVLYGLSTIVGAGIYVIIGEVAEQAGMGMPIAFLAAGMIAACTGVAYAELSARFPEAAGAAAYVAEAFQPPVLARITGLLVLMSGIVIGASLARGAAGYLAEFVSIPLPVLSGAFVLLFTGVACLNVRDSVGLAVALTIVELGGLGLVIAAGAPAVYEHAGKLGGMIPRQIAEWRGVGAGAFVAFFAYIGFESLANMAEEAKEPHRNLPRAIILSIALSSALYIAVATVAVAAVPIDQLINSTAPLATVLQRSLWAPPELLVAIALVAVPNGLLADLLMTSRLLYGMGARGLAPNFLALVSEKSRVPIAATITAGVAMVMFAAIVPFGHLVSATSALTLGVFLLVNISLFRLHRKDTHHVGARAPKWIPPLAILLCIGLLLAQALDWVAN